MRPREEAPIPLRGQGHAGALLVVKASAYGTHIRADLTFYQGLKTWERDRVMDRWFDRSPYLYDENVYWEIFIGAVVVCATVVVGVLLSALELSS